MKKIAYRTLNGFYLVFMFLVCSHCGANAQAHVRLMSYNLLNFPTGNITTRIDTLKKIVDYYQPHLFMIQELENEAGLDSITAMMNTLGYGNFDHGTFVPQQSNSGGGDNPLQQNIVFDTTAFRMVHESVILTEYRDINEFVFYINDPELATGADTSFLYVYVTHLKSSQGATESAIRLSMVNSLLDHLETIPPNSNVIFAGDFNFYNNLEPAYEAIVANNNPIGLVDIFEGYGNWVYSGFAHKEILTQSTREDVIYNDGASGGIDDRFDFIIVSESLMDSQSPLRYVEDSYLSLGNTGECLNLDIVACQEDNPVPIDILIAMYYMSDHLPQVMELQTVLPEVKPVEELKFGTGLEFLSGNLIAHNLELIVRSGISESAFVSITDLHGRVLYNNMHMTNGPVEIDCTGFSSGLYLLSVAGVSGHEVIARFGVTR